MKEKKLKKGEKFKRERGDDNPNSIWRIKVFDGELFLVRICPSGIVVIFLV